MKKLLLPALCVCTLFNTAVAQDSRIAYRTILQLNPGEQINDLLTCWNPDENHNPGWIVIQQPGGKYATITAGVRKSDLTHEQVYASRTCINDNTIRPQKDSHLQFGRLLPNGKWNIRSDKKDYGTYDNIMFMRESGTRFVAIVTIAKEQFLFIDSDGQKTPLEGHPENLITNQDLSGSAVIFRTTDLTRRVWLSENKTITVLKDSRLSFDMSGRHFIEAQPKVFYIDGKPCQRNISGVGTQLFVNQDGNDWACFYMSYLSFKNNTNLQNTFHPFLTTEDGNEYLNWFMIQKENNYTVLRIGIKQWH